jgi:hypothetical protein
LLWHDVFKSIIKMKKHLLLTLSVIISGLAASSQNLITGSTMDDATPWTNGGCVPEIAAAPESAYGGPSGTNNVSEIDFLTCMQQSVTIVPGTVYTINFQAFRRTTCAPDLGPNPGINVKITGVTSGTVYSSVDYHYTGNDDPPGPWPGYTNETQTYSIPGAATDVQVRIDITAIDNVEGCGVVMDNFTMQATGVLPVSLSSFNAASKGTGIELSWATSNEVNSAYFTVLRSANGVNFTEIGKVNASGSANGSVYYFTDAAPNNGINYYRLKQNDKNNGFKLSGIVKVNLNATDYHASVYPTIVSSVLNYYIESPKAAKLNIVITDMTGKALTKSLEAVSNGTTQKSINVTSLSSGMYMLVISDVNSGFNKTIKFTKN